MKDYKSELSIMVTVLKVLFANKKTLLERKKNMNAYTVGKIKNVQGYIDIFESSTTTAAYDKPTVSAFKKNFEEIRTKIKDL